MENARYTAVKLLDGTFEGGGYSNIKLSAALGRSDMDERDKRLCAAIYYGVILRKITLDHIIGALSSRPTDRIDGTVLNILRAGIYQLLYMDSIPDSAAVNESVSLAARFGRKSASGFVNAVLRRFIRQGKTFAVPSGTTEALVVKYSAPGWLVKSLCDDYGSEKAQELLADALGRPPLTIRHNTTACSGRELMAELEENGITADGRIPGCFVLGGGGDPAATDAFAKGHFHVQDRASQLCCIAVAPSEGDTVIDMCAAPGGKTFTMAEMMGGKGVIYASDLREKRVELIKDGARRLGLGNIKAVTADATLHNSGFPEADRILCDVPCSGLGVIRRKPEIKYKTPEEFSSLPDLQYRIAENALGCLKRGGELVYSTCTLRKAENDDVVERLLGAHAELEPVPVFGSAAGSGIPGSGGKLSVFPSLAGSDGFFIAKMRKVR